MSTEKYGFVYVWHNTRKNKFYVGCHWGTEDDGYICSSKMMRNAYAYDKSIFKRRIVQRVYTNRQDLLEAEFRWLDQIKDEELGKKYYNLSKRHFGHWTSIPDEDRVLSLKEKISKKTKEAMQRPDVRQKYEEGLKKRPKSQTEEHRAKRSESMKKAMAEKFPDRKVVVEFGSEEYRENMAKSVSESWKSRDKIAIGSKISDSLSASKESRSKTMSSLKWYNNGQINKRLPDHPGTGWVTGRIKP